LAYNRLFEIDLNEMRILESALQMKLSSLSKERYLLQESECSMAIDDEIKKIREFLGSIHNQKFWYRPKDKIYVSG